MLDGQFEAATKTYQQLQGVSALGSSIALTGLWDLASITAHPAIN
jgi:hypothetical protein